jgi:hypothetical protein
MHNIQAIVVSCIDDRLRLRLNNFIENELNLYAVALKLDNGGCRKIYEDGPVRDWIFDNINFVSANHGTERVILINHTDCHHYRDQSFPSVDEEIKIHEIHLRHSVSAVRARFPSKQIDAYLALMNPDDITFKKVV